MAQTATPLIRYDFTAGPLIYFIQVQRGGAIKIGISSQLADCYGALQIANPAPLEILGVVMQLAKNGEAVCDALAALQTRFHGQRIHGDWYRPAQELLDHIAENAAPVPLSIRPVKRHEPSLRDVAALADESQTELPPGFVRPDEVATYLGVSIVTVRRWTRSGLLPHYQIGPAIIRYDLAEVIEAIGDASNTVGASQPDDLTLQAAQVVAETLQVSIETVRRYTDLFLQALGQLEAPVDEVSGVGSPDDGVDLVDNQA